MCCRVYSGGDSGITLSGRPDSFTVCRTARTLEIVLLLRRCVLYSPSILPALNMNHTAAPSATPLQLELSGGICGEEWKLVLPSLEFRIRASGFLPVGNNEQKGRKRNETMRVGGEQNSFNFAYSPLHQRGGWERRDFKLRL